MTRTLLLLTMCSALALSACGDDRYVLVEVSKPAGWVIETGTVNISAQGTFRYPESVALRFGIESVVDHEPTKIATHGGTMMSFETKSGLPCEVAVEPTCHGTICDAELTVLGAGSCMVRIRATDADGEQRSTCWYRAQFELADPVSSPQVTIFETQVADDYERCLDSL